MDSFNAEALKLGLMGVTILVSSGDNGVAGYSCKAGCGPEIAASSTNCACDLSSNSDTTYWPGSNTWAGNGYIPKFPATSPYITVVGGTSGPEIGSSEVAAQSDHGDVITSGGGFSIHFAQPSWQTSVVSKYFSSLTTSPAQGYNKEVKKSMIRRCHSYNLTCKAKLTDIFLSEGEGVS